MPNDHDGTEPGDPADPVPDLDAFPLSDVLVAMKNAARDGKHYRGVDKPGEDPAEAAPVYPYTKGIELTNDGIGYGEETSIVVVEAKGDGSRHSKRSTRYARRTRSGSRFLKDGEPTLPPSPAPRLSAARETPGSE